MHPAVTDLFRNPTQPVATRVDDLLRRLTLREKVGQLNQRMLGWDSVDPYRRRRGHDQSLRPSWTGGAASGRSTARLRADAWSGRDWTNGADPRARPTSPQRSRSASSRRPGTASPRCSWRRRRTVTRRWAHSCSPTNIGAAATWRPELLEAAAAHTARELRARGRTWPSSPGWTCCATRAGAAPRSASVRTGCSQRVHACARPRHAGRTWPRRRAQALRRSGRRDRRPQLLRRTPSGRASSPRSTYPPHGPGSTKVRSASWRPTTTLTACPARERRAAHRHAPRTSGASTAS